LGQAALEMFSAAGAEVMAFSAAPRRLTLRTGGVVPSWALSDLAGLRVPALVFHCAYLTREHASRLSLSDYVAANETISALVQNYIKRSGTLGVFLPSSGAVYLGNELADNPYGVLKRRDEAVFKELTANCVVMRIFNLSGPYINKLDSYVLACIIKDYLAGGPVRLRAAHPVWRAYTHVADVVDLAACLLMDRVALPVFDTGGEAIEISALARRVAGPGVKIIRPDWESGVADRYLGDDAMFTQIATQQGLTLRGLDQQITETVDYIAQIGSAITTQ
jgi:nucleoside-diphosphate-sugar epimerase